MSMSTIEVRRGTSTDWASANPVLASGEPGYETDTGRVKFGNGATAWIALPHLTLDSDLYAVLAADPGVLVSGSITRDGTGNVTAASVVWPDGSPGTFSVLSRDATWDAVNSYQITYGSPVTRTYTQPAVARDDTGAVTNVPAITES